ncbi:hypothetical protein Ccar_02290 [Clostridium carboxidivorans P7]|uniref:DUF1657 domain-containing protein n=1 Tax=Clostridium carboxidivorans P7 TaxID=536227 RepID=C6PWC0_9CLOT|nr:DUF1657 domain-containing protein [Clostridium carboxidivorans]AKN29738.1 hypothetical protein Ccar_02290 [Clostridium carboxidivorans P7]EET86470.1 protein of unknown function DUF1657 [Clostridium carboxidivorans P7]EFG89319.1 hypothetical protein CLCAR_0472 [Clostridium carboxidivorans P7]
MTVASKLKQTISSLKGAQSTLRIYSLQAQNKELKVVYRNAVKDIDEVIQSLKKREKAIELEEPQYKSN